MRTNPPPPNQNDIFFEFVVTPSPLSLGLPNSNHYLSSLFHLTLEGKLDFLPPPPPCSPRHELEYEGRVVELCGAIELNIEKIEKWVYQTWIL